jgi:hypothetical protein
MTDEARSASSGPTGREASRHGRSPARDARAPTSDGRPSLREIVREVFFGMVGYEFSREARERRAHLETLFMVVTMGDVIGLPVLPPYYSLRLLPFAAADVERWKRRVLREREFHEEHEFHLHGL